MSAVPVFIPQDVISPARPCDMPHEATILRAAATPPTCQLTDRGVAVVILVAAIIMIAALAVIGLTAVRVTGPGVGYDAAVHGTSQAHP